MTSMFSRFGRKKDRLRISQNPLSDERQRATPSLPSIMLFLAQPLSIDSELLLETLRSRCKKSDGTEPLLYVANTLVNFAGITVAVLAIPHPLPEGWRELASTGRNPHWPKALEVCAPHRAHIVLSVMGDQTNMLQATRVLTAVAGAITALYPNEVLAGLWGIKVLNSQETWERLSVLVFGPHFNLPISLWVTQHPFRNESTGGLGVLTQGLARFIGREVELVGPSSDLKTILDRAYGLTEYLVQNGAVLKDGSTFGISEQERIAVNLRDSERFSGLPVIAASLM